MMSIKQNLREGLVDYLPQIRKIVSKIARYEDIVDDLSQEICVRVIEKEKLWKQENKLKSWINSITRNMTITHISKKKPQQQELKENAFLTMEMEQENFSEDHIQWILNQFKTLTEKQQQVLKMKYYQNMKVTEIARKLNISHPTVSEHLNSALKTLRKRAKAEGLLTFLIPWKWDLRIVSQVVVMSKIKIIAVFIVVLGIVTFLVSVTNGSITNQSESLNHLSNIKTVKKISQEHKKSERQVIEKPLLNSIAKKDQKMTDVVVEKTEGSNNLSAEDVALNESLKKTLKWIKSIDKFNRYQDLSVEELKNLDQLSLHGLEVTDSDMHHLKRLNSLTYLGLSLTKITDEGLKELSGLNSLATLKLSSTKITDKGLKELSGLSSLTYLKLSRTEVTGEGLEGLSSNMALTYLDLTGTKVNNKGVEALSTMSSLRILTLTGEQVTDDSISALLNLTSLKMLGLGNTQITEEGSKILKVSLPDCKIEIRSNKK